MKTAPGWRLSRWMTSRASTGRVRIVCSFMVLPTLASTVLRRPDSPRTVRLSLARSPIESCTSRRARTSTASSSFWNFALRKPDRVTVKS
jgi:hypothetical protein